MAYVSVRRYRVQSGSVWEIAQRVKSGFVPIVNGIQGFQNYYPIDGGQDELVTVRVFDSLQSAPESTQRSAEWVRRTLAQYVVGSPQVTNGEVLVSS